MRTAAARRFGALFAAACLVVSLSTGVAGADEMGSISGRVSDQANGSLAGVHVSVIDAFTSVVTTQVDTAADGTYTAAALPPSSYVVCFFADQATGGASTTGYLDECWDNVPAWDGIQLDQVTKVVVTGGGTSTGIDAALAPGGAISGTVSDTGAHPLAGVTVFAEAGPGSPPQTYGQATTAADGTYNIERLPAASQYTVCFDPDNASGGTSTTGYLLQCFSHVGGQSDGQRVVPWTGATYFPVTQGATAIGKNAVLDAAGQISGTVTNSDGDPIPGVRVYAWGPDEGGSFTATDVTDAEGHYLVSVDNNGGGANGLAVGARLPIQPYTLYFSAVDAPAYVSATYPTLVSPAAGTPTVIDQQLAHAARISGRVTDSAGNPLQGVRVSLLQDGYQLQYVNTPADGRYAFTQLAAGSYTVCFDASNATGGISPAGYFDECYDGATNANATLVTVTEGQQRTGVGAHLASASRIVGTVTNLDGQPIANVRVAISDYGTTSFGGAYTDFDGKYTSARLPAGKYQVCFFYSSSAQPGYKPECHADVEIGDAPTAVHTTVGKVTQIDAVLATAATSDTTPPSVELIAPTNRFQLSKIITVDFSGNDAGSGVASYDVRYRVAPWNGAFGAYQSPFAWQYTPVDKVWLTGSPGSTYCFSARAHDPVGNTSAYTADRCVTLPLDDRALHASDHWARTRPQGTYLNSLTSSNTKGATLTLRGAQLRRLALVVRTCPSCGKVAIALNGVRYSTADTYSATRQERVILVQPRTTLRTATITLRVVTAGKPVHIDGLAISRT